MVELGPVKAGEAGTSETALQRLVREGKVRPAKGDLLEYLREHPPAQLRPGERTLSEVLQEMRDEDDR